MSVCLQVRNDKIKVYKCIGEYVKWRYKRRRVICEANVCVECTLVTLEILTHYYTYHENAPYYWFALFLILWYCLQNRTTVYNECKCCLMCMCLCVYRENENKTLFLHTGIIIYTQVCNMCVCVCASYKSYKWAVLKVLFDEVPRFSRI